MRNWGRVEQRIQYPLFPSFRKLKWKTNPTVATRVFRFFSFSLKTNDLIWKLSLVRVKYVSNVLEAGRK